MALEDEGCTARGSEHAASGEGHLNLSSGTQRTPIQASEASQALENVLAFAFVAIILAFLQ